MFRRASLQCRLAALLDHPAVDHDPRHSLGGQLRPTVIDRIDGPTDEPGQAAGPGTETDRLGRDRVESVRGDFEVDTVKGGELLLLGER